MTGFGDSSLDFVLRFRIRDPQGGVMNVKGEVLLAVWDAFKEHGIEIPYPHRQLLIRDPVEVRTQERPAEG
jgi:small-conductance mechanosensitive channel